MINSTCSSFSIIGKGPPMHSFRYDIQRPASGTSQWNLDENGADDTEPSVRFGALVDERRADNRTITAAKKHR